MLITNNLGPIETLPILGKGLLSYLNFSPNEKKQLAGYLRGENQAPILEPKITRGEIIKFKAILRKMRTEPDDLLMKDWAAAKASELKLLDEYIQFIKTGNLHKFKTSIFSYYGEPDKVMFHFHLNNLVGKSISRKRNKIIIKELQGLLAREIATDPAKHHEYEVSVKDFQTARATFKIAYKLELRLLRQALKEFNDDEYSARDICNLLNRLLQFYRLDEAGWKTKVRKETDKVSINRLQLEVHVANGKFRFSKSRMIGLLLHEISVHLLSHQNILDAKATPRNSSRAIEEGLGVFVEQLVLNKPHYMRVYRYLAIGLALGIDGTPRDMKQVYEILWRLRYLSGQSRSVDYAKDYAIKEVLRVFRGIPPTVTGVVLTKDRAYLEGNHFIWELVKRGDTQLIFNGFLGKEIKDNIKV